MEILTHVLKSAGLHLDLTRANGNNPPGFTGTGQNRYKESIFFLISCWGAKDLLLNIDFPPENNDQ